MAEYRVFDAKDWPLYIDEVQTLYIGERKRVKDLIAHFQGKYGFNVTDDQFKKLFKRQTNGPNGAAWSKNLTANQWDAINSIVVQRKQDGKESKLVRNGREYDDETLQRDRKRVRKGRKACEAPSNLDHLITTPSPAAGAEPRPLLLGPDSPCARIMTPSPAAGPSPRPLSYGPDSPCTRRSLSWLGAPSMAAKSTVNEGVRGVHPEPHQFPVLEHPSPSYSSWINWSPDAQTNGIDRHGSRGTSPGLEVVCHWSNATWHHYALGEVPFMSNSRMTADYLYRPEHYHIVALLEQMGQNHVVGFFPGHPPSQTTQLCPPVSESWSIDGLRIIACAVSSSPYLSSRLWHGNADIHIATAAELLDIAVRSTKHLDFLVDRMIDSVGSIATLLFDWFTNIRHLPLLTALMKIKTKMLCSFALSWVNLLGLKIEEQRRQQSSLGIESDAWNRSIAIMKQQQSSVLAVIQAGPNAIITEHTFQLLLDWVIRAGDSELCRQYIRFMREPHWYLDDFLLTAIEAGQSGALEVLLKAKLQLSNQNIQQQPTPGDCDQALAHRMTFLKRFLWHNLLRHHSRKPEVVRVLNNSEYCGANHFPDPCWSGLSTLDFSEFLDPQPSSNSSTSDSHALETAHIVHIARAARNGGPRQIDLLRSNFSFSEYDLQLALLGATAAGSADILEALLQAGVDPNASAVITTQQKDHRCDDTTSLTSFCLLNTSPLAHIYRQRRVPLRNASVLFRLLLCHGAKVTSDTVWTISNILRQSTIQDVEDIFNLRPDLLEDYGSTLLCIACWLDDSVLVARLLNLLPLDIGNSPAVPNPEPYSDSSEFDVANPFQYSIFSSSLEQLKTFWERGGRFRPSPDGGAGDGGFELILAIMGTPVDAIADKVRFLLSKAATADCEITLSWWYRSTPLSAVLSRGSIGTELQLSILEMLLDAGADPNRVFKGQSPVDLACKVNSPALVGALILKGAKLKTGGVILSLLQGDSVRFGGLRVDLDLLRLLTQECRNARIDIKDSLSRALIAAAGWGWVHVAALLLEEGADFTRRYHDSDLASFLGPSWDYKGKSAIEVAAVGGWVEMVHLLIDAERRGLGTAEVAPCPVVQTGDSEENLEDGKKDRATGALSLAQKREQLDVIEVLEGYLKSITASPDLYEGLHLMSPLVQAPDLSVDL